MKLDDAGVNQVRHHGILAHGLGVQAVRANAKSGTKVGLAENANVYMPIIETKEHIEATRKATRDRQRFFLTPVMEGKYPDEYLQKEGANAPKVEPGDMKAIGSPLDFVGLNVYTADYVRADASNPLVSRSKSDRPRIRTWRRHGSTSRPSLSTGRFEIPATSGKRKSSTSPKTVAPPTT